MDYIAQKGYTTPSEVHNDTDYFNSSYILLQNSFAAIGIRLEMDSTSNPTKLTFTLPSGRISVLNNLQGVWDEQIRFVSRLRVTDTYFKQTMSYYNLEEEDSIDLKEVGANAAGYNTYWNYNETNQTVEISGNGTLANFNLWKELKISKVSTMILGAGVYRLLKYSLNSENLVIVDFHGENDPILIEPLCAVDKKLIIYSNNKSMREYDWAKYGVNVEWHNLSEWDE